MASKKSKLASSTPNPRKGTPAAVRDSATSLARLFELASRSLHSAGFANGLFPAQWTTLRYLANAPELARTAAHLARFQQMAIGPVSRTVRTLIAKGLVTKAGQGTHHRSELLALTAEGLKLLEHDPLRRVTATLKALPAEEHARLAEIMIRITASLHSTDAVDEDLDLHPGPITSP